MSNPYFVALYSTDEVYVRQNQTECLSEELDAIKASIPDPVNPNAFAAADHTHQPEAISAHMGQTFYAAPSGGEYVTLPLTTSVVVGTGLTIENNAIKIGAGISKVRISAQVCVGSSLRTVKYLAIRKNSNTQLARAQIKLGENTTAETMAIASLVVNVAEGDLLTLDFYGEQNDTIYGGINLTYITVEKLA
jgi:hypothetical protein